MTTAPLSCEELQRIIDLSPFNRWLQLAVGEITRQGVVLRIPFREDMVGNAELGVLHGGVMSALIDTAGCYAVVARTGRAVATIDLRVDFHVAASGSDLYAHAEILRLGKNLGSVDVRVLDSSDRLVASGKVLCINPKSA